MTLEACVGNLDQAVNAELLGAHQIELCDRLDLDGISPDLDTVIKVCNQVTIPVKVIVNPNPYNYNYSADDIKKIEGYVRSLNDLPIDGIVFGPLGRDGFPDLELISRIASITSYPITFHKAIDISADILKSTQLLLEQNIVRYILSSGGQSTAIQGVNMLKQMKTILQGTDLEIIAAGSITSENLPMLHEQIDLSYYHGKKIVGYLS